MGRDAIEVALIVARALEGLGIPYLVGGSVASTMHGEPRSTLDVDFAIQLEPERAAELCGALGEEFYFDEESVREAARRKGQVNVIHRPSMVKADLYVRPNEGLFASEMARAVLVKLRNTDEATLRVATPEDTLLQKLRRYEAGDRVSDRQWRDVVGILKTRGARLDRQYLEHWADELDLTSLLERALRESGVDR